MRRRADRALQPSGAAQDGQDEVDSSEPQPADVRLRETYWLASNLLLRCLGLVYLAAFLTVGFQGRALFGPNGLEPRAAGPFATSIWANHESSLPDRPTPAFALIGFGDWQISAVAWAGVFTSLVLVSSLVNTFVIPLILWLLWISIVNLKSQFIFNYGWEWQLCETGFLAIFLCPLTPSICAHAIGHARTCPPPYVVMCLFRWLAFRAMIGAGLSKIDPLTWHAGTSSCWEHFTCTTTHYFTQPNPNPLSWFMHHMPLYVHYSEVAMNHFAELVVPWFFLVPWRPCRLFAGCASLVYMACVATTGNYAYINHVTALAFIACLDDAFLARLLPRSVSEDARKAEDESGAASLELRALLQRGRDAPAAVVGPAARHAVFFCLALLVASKSVAPLAKTFGPRPWLDFYDDYMLVNAMGVFGFINSKRYELVIHFTHDGQVWEPLEFACKPGGLDRIPCVVNPYHYRFDWVAWIETTASLESQPLSTIDQAVPDLIMTAAGRMMHGDTDAAGLFGTPPSRLFAGGHPPTAMRFELYDYTFSDASALFGNGEWWQRRPIFVGDDGVELPLEAFDHPGAVADYAPTHDGALFYATLAAFAAAASRAEVPASHRGLAIATLGACTCVKWVVLRLLLREWMAAWTALAVGLGIWRGLAIGPSPKATPVNTTLQAPLAALGFSLSFGMYAAASLRHYHIGSALGALGWVIMLFHPGAAILGRDVRSALASGHGAAFGCSLLLLTGAAECSSAGRFVAPMHP